MRGKNFCQLNVFKGVMKAITFDSHWIMVQACTLGYVYKHLIRNLKHFKI